MIGCHELDGLAAQESHAVETPQIQHHLQEARVVGGGRHQPTAARFKLRRTFDIKQLHARMCIRILGKGFRQTRLLVERYVERRVRHSQRREYTLLQELSQRHARQDLHQSTHHISRAAVLPLRARLMHQRQLAQAGHLIGIALVTAVDSCGVVHLVDRPAAAELVRQARGMAQQILNGDGTLRIHLPQFRALRDRDFHVAQLGEKFTDRVAEQESAFLPEHHDRHRDDGFGHRINAKNAVERHRRAARGIAPPKTLVIGQLTSPRDERHRARHPAALNLVLHHPAQSGKAGSGKSDIFRRGARQRE